MMIIRDDSENVKQQKKNPNYDIKRILPPKLQNMTQPSSSSSSPSLEICVTQHKVEYQTSFSLLVLGNFTACRFSDSDYVHTE